MFKREFVLQASDEPTNVGGPNADLNQQQQTQDGQSQTTETQGEQQTQEQQGQTTEQSQTTETQGEQQTQEQQGQTTEQQGERNTMSNRMRELSQARRDAEERERQANARLERALAALERTGTNVDDTRRQTEEDARPTPPEFSDPTKFGADMAKYTEDLIQWTAKREIKAQSVESQRQVDEQARQRHAETVNREFQRRRSTAMSTLPDYVEIAENPDLDITPTMASAIAALPEGTDVAYHLGKNPAEATRIAMLPVGQQLIEIGVLKATLAVAKGKQKPQPPAPIKPQGAGQSTRRTTVDIGNDEDSSMEEYASLRTAEMRGGA